MIYANAKKEGSKTEGRSQYYDNYSNSKDNNSPSQYRNKFVYYMEEFIFQYILFIKKIEIFIIDSIKKIWQILSSKEALKVYSIIGQILLLGLVISAIFILFFGLNNRDTRRRRRY